MTRTFIGWLSLLTLFVLLTIGGNAFAAESRIYTIKKGDTLWDLSKKFIDDPYYWPNIWSKNPEITNPHLIFPGQKIRILDGRLEILPAYGEAKAEPAAPTLSLSSGDGPEARGEELLTIKSTGGGNSFILTDEQPLGMIVDSVDNRVLLTRNDIVFVKMHDLGAVTVGDTYGLFERGKGILHPQTKEPLGTMMSNLGFLQVTEISGSTVVAKIAETYREIARGAELFEYIPERKEIALQRGTAEQHGLLVAARDGKGSLSTNDIIFVNLGSADGLKSGNLLYISRPRLVSKEILEQAGDMELPDAVLGAAVAIEAKSGTASAIIIKSVDAAFIGDKVSVVTD